MTQYRAVLKDPGRPEPDRPIQILSMSLRDVDDWVAETLGGGTQLQGTAKIQISDQARVDVYVIEEKLTATYDVKLAREIRDRKLHNKQSERIES